MVLEIGIKPIHLCSFHFNVKTELESVNFNRVPRQESYKMEECDEHRPRTKKPVKLDTY